MTSKRAAVVTPIRQKFRGMRERRRRRTARIAAMAVAGAGVALAGVLHAGPLRSVFSDRPVGFVARLNIQGAGQCSAVLIAPRLAVTAAHCLRHPRSGRIVSEDRAHLLFGYDKGRWIAHRRVSAFGFSPGHGTTGGLEHDWALLAFENPVEGVTPPDLRSASVAPAEDESFSTAGYGAPRKEVMSVAEGCAFRSLHDSVLSVGCALSGGASGGPVLDVEGRLAAVLVAISGDDQGEVGLAAMLTAESVAEVAAQIEQRQRASLER